MCMTTITAAYNELTSQPSAAPLPQGSLDKSRQRGQDDSVETSYYGVSEGVYGFADYEV